jgi:hypothetical protein
MYSVARSVKLKGLDPELYLRNVRSRIALHPIERIEAQLSWIYSGCHVKHQWARDLSIPLAPHELGELPDLCERQ